MTTLITFIAIIGLILASWLTWFLLKRATAWGGERDDALDITAKFIAETQTFRGSSNGDGSAWDGKNRIAPPTQEGG